MVSIQGGKHNASTEYRSIEESDERLIHGQGQLWIKALGVNTVIVANDSASEDAMQQTLMKAVVPKTIAMRFFSIQHTCVM